MQCRCSRPKQVSLSYTQRVYCERCFLRLLLRRVRRELRHSRLFKPGETVFLLNDGSKEAFIASWLLKEIFKGFLKVRPVKTLRNLKGKKVLPWSLDREIKSKLNIFLTAKKPKRTPFVHFPKSLLEEEIVLACKILSFKKIKKDPPHELVDALEKFYPGTKFGLFKAVQEVEF